MSSRIKKRFIAGANCPKCQAQDSLMLYKEHNVEKVECVHCGHQQSQGEQQVTEKSRQNEALIGVFKPE